MLQEFNPKNKDIKVWVGNKLYPRNEAKVSVFDSIVQGGDGVWEGLRIYDGHVFCLDQHLERLEYSAKALAFEDIPDRKYIKKALADTLKANGMTDQTHVRLTLTRGEKITSGMDPRLNTMGANLIILAEWKPLVYDNENGIRVITSSIQRNSPRHLDSKIHHNNLLNNILAKVQANFAGVDAGVMLDTNGFVSELNDTNLFMVHKNKIYTPHADACLPGITRGLVIDVAKDSGHEVIEKNLSINEFYNGDEVFCTGTMGELTPVKEIDGRKIENKTGTNLREFLVNKIHELIPTLGERIDDL
ncbi:aminotransferase class IV [Mangrovivirga sp. M17]|uniref:branched-chain-amino-acid transaminase n=1 Tax=Mangrovivirga halotolerans TaxID=2993936 RepID=A0ABT3RQZ4_9BACT|nr:aminotransferase class IV [Mangrovivirga halotolerans]MCX2744194.1 aminotransferase class IV [Mangrovivirga halotolerans]